VTRIRNSTVGPATGPDDGPPAGPDDGLEDGEPGLSAAESEGRVRSEAQADMTVAARIAAAAVKVRGRKCIDASVRVSFRRSFDR
jgi:hypothetical protein